MQMLGQRTNVIKVMIIIETGYLSKIAKVENLDGVACLVNDLLFMQLLQDAADVCLCQAQRQTDVLLEQGKVSPLSSAPCTIFSR